MTEDEVVELYYLLEDLNEYFHQPDNYSSADDVSEFANKIYPRISKAYYKILWNNLPEKIRKKILEEG